MLKRFLTAITVLSVLFSIPFQVYAHPGFRNSFAADGGAEALNSPYGPEDSVTFIIEVDGDPALASAQAQKMGASLYAETRDARAAESQNLRTQAGVLSGIRGRVAPAAEKGYTYTALFNGFSMAGKFGDREAILALPGVKNVYVSRTRFASEPRLTSAAELTGVPEMTEAFGFRGEGQVVAVLDSEFDTGHDFFASPVTNPKYGKADIDALVKNTALNVQVDSANQVYRNQKIPFAYDYANRSSDTYNSNPDIVHGSHVAGIVGGKNGTAPDGKAFSGVAPEVQMILLKTSDSWGGISDDVVFAALDDAAKFGVSAINMSFGADYLPTSYDADYGRVLDTARNAGIFLSVAAGNADRGYKSMLPLAENIDYAAAGTPNSYPAATSIASVDNSYQYAVLGGLIIGGQTMNYADAYPGAGFYAAFGGGDYEYVVCGFGRAEDFSGLDLSGKLALVKRGENSFAEKAANAKQAGAVGLVLWNDADAYISTDTLSLPAAIIGSTDGHALAGAAVKTLRATAPALVHTPLQNGGKPSGFTSWGTSETLELKPELSAPGGMIYSSIPDNRYQTMGGTSMAAPHITGLAALMNQYYETGPFTPKYNGLSGGDKVALIENLLMSSAVVTRQADGIPESPRRQGAGLANVRNAMTTPVILVGAGGKSKISLGAGIGDSFTLQFTAKNLTDRTVTYDSLSLEVMTDGCRAADGENYVGPMVRLKAQSNLPQSVTVPAGGEQKITAEVTLDPAELAANAKIFKNGFYIDGYVSLAQSGQSTCTVSIPFTGFRGTWRSAPLFDRTMYDGQGSALYISGDEEARGTFLFADIGNNQVARLGENLFSEQAVMDREYIAISPNGDGIFDSVNLQMQLLRAMSELRISVAGADGKPVMGDMVLKASIPKFYPARLDLSALSALPDGDYTVRFQGRYDYPGNENAYDDVMSLPFSVDTQKPVVTGASLNGDRLTVTARDNKYLSAVMVGYLNQSGEERWQIITLDPLKDGIPAEVSVEFGLEEALPDSVRVEVYDYALNVEAGALSDYTGDVCAKLTNIEIPGSTLIRLEVTNRGDMPVAGVAMAAFYDENGRLVQLAAQETVMQPGTQAVTLELAESVTAAKMVRVLLWDGLGGMKPLFAGNTYSLQ